MINLLALIVCFFASVIGAICGIGGGVIIKPVLDSVGILDVTAISFLSGCTVLSMTTYSVLKKKENMRNIWLYDRTDVKKCYKENNTKC